MASLDHTSFSKMNVGWEKMRRINKAEINSVEEDNEWAYVVNEVSLLYGIRTLEVWRKHMIFQ